MIQKRNIPISRPYIGSEEYVALQKPLSSGWLTQGPCVAEFEREFAKIHQVPFAIATSNCTTALHLALVALGIGPGDDVIVPSFTWIATANVVEYIGGKLILCDIDPLTFNIDIAQFKSLITPRTKAVIPVHLFGLCADMDPLKVICQQNNIAIIEDAACAVGASYHGTSSGALGDIGCFSFHPRKIITTGEGGMCTTRDPVLAERLSSLRNHGATISEEQRHHGSKPYLLPDFNAVGFNYRLSDLQGAVGIAQLNRLSALIEERRSWAEWYRQHLSSIEWLRTPQAPSGYGHSYQAFVCYVDETCTPHTRDQIMEQLNSLGIATRPGTHAVHLQNFYQNKYGFRPDQFPVARDCHYYSLALPLHNMMVKEDYEYVVKCLRNL